MEYCKENDLRIINFKNDEENEKLNINDKTAAKINEKNEKIINYDGKNSNHINNNKYFKINFKNNFK